MCSDQKQRLFCSIVYLELPPEQRGPSFITEQDIFRPVVCFVRHLPASSAPAAAATSDIGTKVKDGRRDFPDWRRTWMEALS